MPKKYGKKKSYKKSGKNSKKFKGMKKGSSLLTNNRGVIIPQRFRTKLKFNERLNTESAGVNFTNDVYRVNNVYDPANKTGNYGCNGFRQLGLLYDKYICYGSKIKVTAMSNQVNTVTILTVLPSDHILSSNDLINNVSGMKYAKTGKLMSIATGGSPESMVTNYISCSELFGYRKDEVKYDPSLRMRTNGNLVNGVPFKTGVWNLIVRNGDPDAVHTLATILNIEITYYVEFFDPVTTVAPNELEQDHLELNPTGEESYTALGATGATGSGPFVSHGETGIDGNPIFLGEYN